MAVVFKADSDFSKVVKDYDTLLRKNVALEEKLRNVTREVESQGSGFKNTFSEGVNQLKSMVSNYGSLKDAVNLVNKALQDQRDIGREAHRAQQDVAQSQMSASKVLAGASVAETSAFFKEMERIAAQSGFKSVIPVNQAAEYVLSSTGGNQNLAKLVLSSAAPIMPDDEQGLRDFSGTVAGMARLFGIDDVKDPAEASKRLKGVVGYGLSVLNDAQISGPDKLKHLVPALGGGIAVSGTTPRDVVAKTTGALFAAIGNSLNDYEGAKTETAEISLEAQLKEFLPEDDITGPKGLVRRGTGLKDTDARLRALFSSQKLREEFWASPKHGGFGAHFEMAAEPQIKQLLEDPDSLIRKNYEASRGRISFDAAPYDQMLERFKATPQMIAASRSRELENVIEQSDADSELGTISDITEKTFDTLKRTRGLGIWQHAKFALGESQNFSLDAIAARGGGIPEVAEGAEAMLRHRRETLLLGQMGLSDIARTAFMTEEEISAERSSKANDPAFRSQRLKEMTEAERKMISLLEKMIDKLDRNSSQPGVSAWAAATIHHQQEGM